MAQEKTEFRNATGGTIGVIVVQPGGKEQALPLVSGATIWLSEDDQIATANAPRNDADNPFVNGMLEAVGVPQGVKNRRPIGVSQESDAEKKQREEAEAAAKVVKDAEAAAAKKQREAEAKRLKDGERAAQRGGARPERQSPEETGAPKQPQGKAVEGSRAAGEEVATPEATEATAS
jgi:hypothetical protein